MSAITNQFLNSGLTNMSSWDNRVTYYTFPHLNFSDKARKVAADLNLTVD